MLDDLLRDAGGPGFFWQLGAGRLPAGGMAAGAPCDRRLEARYESSVSRSAGRRQP